MAPPSIAGALAGGYISGEIPGDALLLAIAAVLFYSGYDLLAKPDVSRKRPGREGLDIPAAVLAGAVIGLLGGIVGLILGSLRMPALIRLVGETPARAVGTNVTVGFLVGVAGVIGHLPSEPPGLGPARGGRGGLDTGRAAGLPADGQALRPRPPARDRGC